MAPISSGLAETADVIWEGPRDPDGAPESEDGDDGVFHTPLPFFFEAASNGNKWATALTESFTRCCLVVWQTEIDKRPALRGTSKERWAAVTVPIIAAIPQKFLYELVAGSLLKACIGGQDQELVSMFEFYARHSHFKTDCLPLEEGGNDARGGRPGIYVMALVDENGDAPTPSDLSKIAEVMGKMPMMKAMIDSSSYEKKGTARWNNSRYMVSRIFASPKDWRDGRKVEAPPPPGTEMSEKVEIFARKVTANMQEIPEDQQHVPLNRPLQYIGYSIDPGKRISEHRCHQDSSYIMDLAESVSFNLFLEGTIDTEYSLEGRPIYYLAQPEEAIAAEVLFSCLADGYIESGWGFAHIGAEQSNDSVNCYEEKQWSFLSEFVARTTYRKRNLREECQRLVRMEQVASKSNEREKFGQQLQQLTCELRAALEHVDELSQKFFEKRMSTSQEMLKSAGLAAREMVEAHRKKLTLYELDIPDFSNIDLDMPPDTPEDIEQSLPSEDVGLQDYTIHRYLEDKARLEVYLPSDAELRKHMEAEAETQDYLPLEDEDAFH